MNLNARRSAAIWQKVRVLFRRNAVVLKRRSAFIFNKGGSMAQTKPSPKSDKPLTREELIGLLNEDLAREYQAIIAYVVYSQVLKGAEYMNIAAELEVHAGEELKHALTIANQIDYLGGMPAAQPKPVRTSDKGEGNAAV